MNIEIIKAIIISYVFLQLFIWLICFFLFDCQLIDYSLYKKIMDYRKINIIGKIFMIILLNILFQTYNVFYFLKFIFTINVKEDEVKSKYGIGDNVIFNKEFYNLDFFGTRKLDLKGVIKEKRYTIYEEMFLTWEYKIETCFNGKTEIINVIERNIRKVLKNENK